MALAHITLTAGADKSLTWTSKPAVVLGEGSVTDITITWDDELAAFDKYVEIETTTAVTVTIDGTSTTSTNLRLAYTAGMALEEAVIAGKPKRIWAVGVNGTEVFKTLPLDMPPCEPGLTGTSSSAVSTSALTSHILDTADAHDASAISVLDTGEKFAATDVEAALAEVQANLEAHEGDATDAHDASAISVADEGELLTATDVEAALAEIQGNVNSHLTDMTDAHDASAISIADSGSLFTATDVEATLAEIQGNIKAHIDAPTAAHPASAISIVDAGGYFAGADVEAVLQEAGANSRGVVVADVTLDGAWLDGATVDPATDTITVLNATGLANGTPIEFRANTGVLPAGITDYLNGAKGIGDGDYFNVINLSGNSFQICATVGGSTPVDITDAGTAGWQWRVAASNMIQAAGLSLDAHVEYEIIAFLPHAKQTTSATSFYMRINQPTYTQFKVFTPLLAVWGASSVMNCPTVVSKYGLTVLRGRLRKISSGVAQWSGNAAALDTTDRSASAGKTTSIADALIAYTPQDVTDIRMHSNNSGVLLLRNGSRIIVVRRGA